MIILTVEDQENYQKEVVSRLEQRFPFSSIISASDGIEGLEKAEEFGPHVVLVDVNLPGMKGTEMSQEILKRFPATAIIFLSSKITDEEIGREYCSRFGAVAAFSKEDMPGLISVLEKLEVN